VAEKGGLLQSVCKGRGTTPPGAHWHWSYLAAWRPLLCTWHSCVRDRVHGRCKSTSPVLAAAQVWDVVTTPNPNLGGIVEEFPVWTVADYVKQAAALDLRAAVHVEAVVGQKEGASWRGPCTP
jgi:hypothetical protein